MAPGVTTPVGRNVSSQGALLLGPTWITVEAPIPHPPVPPAPPVEGAAHPRGQTFCLPRWPFTQHIGVMWPDLISRVRNLVPSKIVGRQCSHRARPRSQQNDWDSNRDFFSFFIRGGRRCVLPRSFRCRLFDDEAKTQGPGLRGSPSPCSIHPGCGGSDRPLAT